MIRAVRYAGWGALFVLASWALCDFLGRLWMRSGLPYRPGQSAAALGGAVMALLAIAFVALMVVGVVGVALSGASRDHNIGQRGARGWPTHVGPYEEPDGPCVPPAASFVGVPVRPVMPENVVVREGWGIARW